MIESIQDTRVALVNVTLQTPDYKRTLESIIAEVPPGVRPY